MTSGDDDGMMTRPVSMTLAKSKSVKFQLVTDFDNEVSDNDDEDNMLNMMYDDDNLSMNGDRQEDAKHS